MAGDPSAAFTWIWVRYSAREVGPRHPGVLRIGTEDVRVGQIRTGQINPAQVAAAQARTAQIGVTEVDRSPQVRTGDVSSPRVAGANEFAAAQQGSPGPLDDRGQIEQRQAVRVEPGPPG